MTTFLIFALGVLAGVLLTVGALVAWVTVSVSGDREGRIRRGREVEAKQDAAFSDAVHGRGRWS